MKHYTLPTPQSKVDAVILANGDFPSHNIPLSILSNNNYIVCCDGAVNKLSRTDIQPHAIVGDFDSLSETNRIKYANILHNNPNQETNDLTKAVDYCISIGFKKLIIVGATGQREDHTLANISLLLEYMEKGIDVQLITDYGLFVPLKENSSFDSFEGQQVSMFSFEKSPITTQNLKYPVNNRIFTNWWQGTLNESISNQFIIETTGKMIVYRIFK